MNIVNRRFTAFKVCSWNEILVLLLVGWQWFPPFSSAHLFQLDQNDLIFRWQRDAKTYQRGRKDEIVNLSYSLYSQGNSSQLIYICSTPAGPSRYKWTEWDYLGGYFGNRVNLGLP